VENVSILVAIGVGMDGHREVIGMAEGIDRRTRPAGTTSSPP
jgi:transposase-like protein